MVVDPNVCFFSLHKEKAFSFMPLHNDVVLQMGYNSLI